MHKPLSPRQADTLKMVRDYIETCGYPPTLRELAKHMGISIHAANGHLVALEKKGAIRRTEGVARGITIVIK